MEENKIYSMDEIIKKVNLFAKISKERELTDLEKEERAKFRKLYLEQFKQQVKNRLDNIKIVDEKLN